MKSLLNILTDPSTRYLLLSEGSHAVGSGSLTDMSLS